MKALALNRIVSRALRVVAPLGLALPGIALPASAQGDDCAAGEVYDDGGFELFLAPFYGGPDGRMRYVSRFTPPSYPYAYDEVCLFVRHVPDVPLTFDLVVFDDDGPGGAPGTRLSEMPVSVGALTGWLSVPLDCQSAVNEGSVWIGMRWRMPLANGITLAADTSGPHRYQWSLDGISWSPDANLGTPATLMIRARGVAGNGSLSVASLRNGSGINPLCYAASAPAIGTDWIARVNHAFYPMATFTQIHFRGLPGTGPVIAAGELLLHLGSARLFVSTTPSISLSDLHQHPIPDDASLVGVSLATQGVILGPAGFVLCNAYDLTVGCR